ncbi:MAG: kelch repeat-containing protein [Planctomycetota bacterium]|nr:kelch repeat-containing protein [Planctomycetota bacterium]
MQRAKPSQVERDWMVSGRHSSRNWVSGRIRGLAALLVFFLYSDHCFGQQQPLPTLLTIEWKKGPSLPQGFQDSQGGIVDQWLVSACGFCSGQTGVPGKPNTYPRGFLKKTWAFNLKSPSQKWEQVALFPGSARQGMQAVTVNNRIYFWGGFSYSKPFCYQDGYCLSRQQGAWKWDSLPKLPWPVTAAGMCASGSSIFFVGGADYDQKQFYSAADRYGKFPRLGARLMKIDTRDLKSGWSELTPCPGTPRWVHAMAAVDGKLYVFGGATGSDNIAKTNCTVVDNWQYDVALQKWARLADLPIASGNFPSTAVVFADRYILLVGGYQYSNVLGPDGKLRPLYGVPQRRYQGNPMCSDIFVYDTQKAVFGRATSLILNNNLPMTVVSGNRIHLVGGEIQSAVIDEEHFGHHPDLYLTGTIRVPAGNPRD